VELNQDEVAGYAHPPEALSSRRETSARGADRDDDRRVRPHGGRPRSEIAAEEQKAGISDPNHFAYPTYARAAAQRRDNLRQSAQNLHAQLDDAKAELGEAFEELKKAESLEDRERSLDAAISQTGQPRIMRASA
jgi:hypothetical protein